MHIKKIRHFIIKNYFLLAFFILIMLVGLVSLYKFEFSKSTYVYVKIKVGQGYWWASTVKPSIWLVNSIRKGDKVYDLLGRTQAEVLGIRYYPSIFPSQYDMYVTLRLQVSVMKKTKSYTFNRSALSVSSPIELQFPNADITGSVMQISPTRFHDVYVEKTIYLANQGGYSKDFPYRYDSIPVGDTYFDGENTVFTILSKQLEKNIWSVQNNLNAQIYEQPIETTQNIIVKAKVRLQVINGEYYYNDDYRVYPNAPIPFSTSHYFFENFTVRKIE